MFWLRNKKKKLKYALLSGGLDLLYMPGHNKLNNINLQEFLSLSKYSKTCLKWPLKDRQNKGLKVIW